MTDVGSSETPSYGNPNRMHVLANGDIVDCGRLPQTARNNLYKTELCKHHTENGNCRYGPKCQFAHGEDELRGVLRHPKYKTTRCKAYLSTRKCMYGSRCRFLHTRHPGEEDQRFVNYGSSDLSSTASESDDLESPSKDLLVNPYGNVLEPIDLSQPFGDFSQPFSLAPLLSVSSPPKPEFDSYQTQTSRRSFLDYSFQSSDLGNFGLRSSSCSAEALNAVSPRSASSTESATSKFSRLTIFQRICRENE